MANSIVLAEKYKAALDQAYKLMALTLPLEAPNAFVQPTDQANVVKVATIVLQGLADYDRATGHTDGDISLTWQPFTLAHDRGRRFQVDAMDDFETLHLPTLNLMTTFLRERVVPEVDAIRFATMATNGQSIETGAIADSAAAVAAWKAARKTLDGREVPKEGRISFMSDDFYYALEADKVMRERLKPAEGSDSRFEKLDGITVVQVPQARFYTAIELASSGDGGFSKGATAQDINFQIIHPSAAAAVTKHVKPRIFGPDVNQKADATQFDYRIYHDLITPANKKGGIYTHAKPAA